MFVIYFLKIYSFGYIIDLFQNLDYVVRNDIACLYSTVWSVEILEYASQNDTASYENWNEMIATLEFVSSNFLQIYSNITKNYNFTNFVLEEIF